MGKKLDFKGVNALALSRAESVVSYYVPNGKLLNGEWIARNPTRDDGRPGSFSINVSTGVWADFATDDKGGDLISYVAYVQRVSQGEAYRQLRRFLGLPDDEGESRGESEALRSQGSTVKQKGSDFTPIFPPPPEAAQSCPSSFRQFGKASQYWDYRSADGGLLMRVCRFDRTTSKGERAKEYRPVVYGRRQTERTDRTGWHWRQLPENRPLYGLDVLADFETMVPVVLVEGEKACDAARALFPSHPCMTWSGGSKAVGKTDWRPLAGREVWLWPDNDEAGEKTIDTVGEALVSVGASGFRVVNLAVFSHFQPASDGHLAESPTTWPNAADAFDAREMGWTAAHFDALEARGALLLPVSTPTAEAPLNAPTNPPADAPSSSPFGYRVDDSGVWCYDLKAEKYRRICARLEVLARSRDGNGSGNNWGLLVAFNDHDGIAKQWNIHMRLFATDGGAEVVRGLLDRGLDIDAHRESKRKVLDYLQAASPSDRVGLVYKMGWHGSAFVMPDTTIGSTDETLLFYSEGSPLCKLSQHGTLADWQEQISQYCKGNPLALFAISAAFAGPLVELLGQETMGFHFYGDSSWGKSTLLNLACSVFGNPEEYKKTWRATDNALEGVAAAHSDMLLGLDEINQVDSRIIGDVVYMLGNGQGKHRAGDRGQARDSHHRWRFTFLSNGEKTLEQYLAEAGKAQTGGMEMRFIGIRASMHEDENTTRRMGVFNTAHGFMGGAALSEHLKGAMVQNHGTAFVAFLEALVREIGGDQRTQFTTRALGALAKFRGHYLSPDAGGQVVRAAGKFALVGLAGELATHWGVTGWERGEARAAAVECFKSWLTARGGEGNLEDKQMLDHVRHQIAKYGESRFKRWDEPEEGTDTVIDSHVPITAESWGYRREVKDEDKLEGDASDVVFYVFPAAFAKDLCKGFDHGRVARLLRDVGALELSESEKREKRLLSKVRLPRMGRKPVAVYRLRNSALFGGQSETEEGEATASGF